MELTVPLLVMRFFAGLVIATFHGAAIAATAVLLGDKGPRYDERLTLNPVRHVDLLGLGSIMLTGFGWSRPVAIDGTQLRWGRWSVIAAILAGSAVLLALAYVLLLAVIPSLTLLPYSAGIAMAAFFRVAAQLCVWMAILSLLPLPPLAGAHLLETAGIRLPDSAGLVVGLALVLASVLGVTQMMLTPVYNVIAPLVLGADLVR